MFHVSTLLAHVQNDPQQLEKKKLIGNGIQERKKEKEKEKAKTRRKKNRSNVPRFYTARTYKIIRAIR